MKLDDNSNALNLTPKKVTPNGTPVTITVSRAEGMNYLATTSSAAVRFDITVAKGTQTIKAPDLPEPSRLSLLVILIQAP